MTRRFTLAISHVLGIYRDIPAPDVNTNAQTMAWMMDAYSSKAGYTPASVTGKPLDLGGAPGREAATGRGCVDVLEAWAKANSVQLDGLRIAIQGFGNVGSWLAHEAAGRGARIVAVSDVSGGVSSGAGLDVEALRLMAGQRQPLMDAPDVDVVTNEELLTMDCDVLVPAALGEVINAGNAHAIKARVVLEAANHPVTPDADKILNDRGVVVIPDILANAGGVIGSYFEWTQNIQQFTWKETQFNQELADRLTIAFEQTHANAERLGCTLRHAAFAIGIERVANASRLRGYI
jgi:glutamate dehydrogenase (NAD(P)+)